MTIYDDSIKHRVNIEKLKNEVAARNILRFNMIYPQLSNILNQLETKKADKLISDINKVIDKEFGILKGGIVDENIDIAVYESRFQSLLISKLLNEQVKKDAILSTEKAKTLVLGNYVQGQLFDKTFDRLGDDFKFQVESAVRLAIVNGEKASDATKRIKGVFNIKKNQLNSLTRTLMANVISISDEEVYKKNKSIIKKYRYVAIMDSRTTDICRELNGKIYEVGNGKLPPQHFNCRSFTIPVIEIEDQPQKLQKVDKTYDEWYQRQENKTGLESTEKERFATNAKKTLEQLMSEIEDE